MRALPVDKSRPLILDCNIWIKMLIEKESSIREFFKKNVLPVILTSYMVVEIERVLRRLALRKLCSYEELDALFWDFCSFDFVIKDFQHPFAESLIKEIKKAPEYRIIAQLLELEVKDVPYIVATYQHNGILITEDLRSLSSKRALIKTRLGIEILSQGEFLQHAH